MIAALHKIWTWCCGRRAPRRARAEWLGFGPPTMHDLLRGVVD